MMILPIWQIIDRSFLNESIPWGETKAKTSTSLEYFQRRYVGGAHGLLFASLSSMSHQFVQDDLFLRKDPSKSSHRNPCAKTLLTSSCLAPLTLMWQKRVKCVPESLRYQLIRETQIRNVSTSYRRMYLKREEEPVPAKDLSTRHQSIVDLYLLQWETIRKWNSWNCTTFSPALFRIWTWLTTQIKE